MELTQKQIALIRQTHEKLARSAEKIGQEFYADLFNRIPEARKLFREDLSDQGMRFMSAINVIVDNLDNLAAMQLEIDKLARGHAVMAIKPEWYRQMQEALIDTFAYAMGADFTNEAELAWRSAFTQICDQMIAFKQSA